MSEYGDFMNEIKFYNTLPPEAKEIRICVFMNEQGFMDEFDDKDSHAVHLVLYANGTAAGTARLFTEDGGKTFHLGRVAVLKQYRGCHLGAKIVNAMCEKAKSLGAQKCVLSAQCRVREFYKTLGFTECGEEYYDEYCPHIFMEKTL